MAYRMPGICKDCGTEYEQISGIDLSPVEQKASNCYYSCPKCGGVDLTTVPLLTWDYVQRIYGNVTL